MYSTGCENVERTLPPFLRNAVADCDQKDDGHPLMLVVAKIADGVAKQDDLRKLVERRAEVGRDIAEKFEMFWLKVSAIALSVEDVA